MLHIPSVQPVVVYAIIAVNVAIFFLRLFSVEIDRELYLWGANNHGAVLMGGEYYRLFTAMFLHAGLYGPRDQLIFANSLHILLNMYILYAVGMQLERLFGHARFAVIYLLGGIAGSVLSALLNGDNVFSVGASGAVFAVLAAEFVFLYQHRKLLGAAAQAQMRSLATWAIINLAFGLFTQFGNMAFRVDNWGHIGGLLGGLGLAWLIAPYYLPRRHPDNPDALVAQDTNPLEQRLWVLALYISLLLAILIVATLVTRA